MASISPKRLGYHVKGHARRNKCLLNIYFVLNTVLGNFLYLIVLACYHWHRDSLRELR